MSENLRHMLRKLADMGILLPAMRRVSKHQTTVQGKGKKRLRMARGAGSINAKADILQLVRTGKMEAACKMANEHERQCGEKLFPDFVLDAWMLETPR